MKTGLNQLVINTKSSSLHRRRFLAFRSVLSPLPQQQTRIRENNKLFPFLLSLMSTNLTNPLHCKQPKSTIMSHSWYSSQTGIYTSINPHVDLPTDPFLDLVSHIFSFHHNGVSALIDSSSGFSIPYSKLFPLVQSMASGLHKMGVSKDDVVLLMIPNSIYYPIVFLSVLYIGAVVTPMSPLSHVSEIRKRIDECGVSLAFTSHENAGKFEALGLSVISVPENFDEVNSSDYSVYSVFSVFYGLINGEPCVFPRPVIKQDDKAAILYSSGTTGVSKGVVLTHRNFISMVELFVRFEASQYEYPSSKNVYLAVLPMFHIYGLSLFGAGLLSLGSTIIVMRTFNINEVIKVIGNYRVTHFPCVPPVLTALTKSVNSVNRSCLQSLIQVSSGAAPLSMKNIEDFIQTLPNVDFIQGYGMTESTAVGTRGFNTEKFQKYSSIGLLAPNMEAKVIDLKTGAFLPPRSSGELWLRGPSNMKGYLNNEEATMSTIDKDGWLHTGDIVWFDEDGYLHISERLKDMIKYKGYQIPPADLEAILILHPEIVDAAVTGVNDEEAGEIPVAFVVKKVGSTLSQKAIMDYVSQQVAPYKKVRKVVFIDSVPRSPAGKILKRQLKRDFLTSKL